MPRQSSRLPGELPEPIQQHVAAEIQAAMIAGNAPAEHLLELRKFRDGPRGSEWFPVRSYRACAARAIELCGQYDVYIGAAPRTCERGRAEDVERVWCLWADFDTPESVAALRKFRPLPNIVNRSGTPGRVHAWWQVPAGLTPAQAVRANRRLALTLGADRASTDAPRIMRLAGTSNHKTDPPVPVECVRLEVDAYTLADVVGGLPDAEEPTPRRPLRLEEPSDATLAGILRTVSEAQEGNRNALLHWGACRLAEHNLIAAAPALRDAALSTGLTEREIDRTIASAFDRRAAA